MALVAAMHDKLLVILKPGRNSSLAARDFSTQQLRHAQNENCLVAAMSRVRPKALFGAPSQGALEGAPECASFLTSNTVATLSINLTAIEPCSEPEHDIHTFNCRVHVVELKSYSRDPHRQE